MEQVLSAGFHTTLIYIGTVTPNLNISRIKQRAMSGGHAVTDEDIIRRYHSSLSNLVCAIRKANISPISTRNAVTKRILSVMNGTLRRRTGVTPVSYTHLTLPTICSV